MSLSKETVMKIYFIEDIGVNIADYQRSFINHQIVDINTRGFSDEKLIEVVADADILCLTNRPLSSKVIESLPNLKFVSVAFAGIDHVDQESCKQRNILIKNAAGYAQTAVAELVLGFMLSLARNIPYNDRYVRYGGVTNTGSELKGKTLGIIGYGAIGKEVERLAIAFNMKVLIFDRNASASSETSLTNIFKVADYISLNVPLTDETRGMINMSLFQIMKKTAYLINCARGPIVNSADLKRALDLELFAGAAIDVFDTEPPLAKNLPLLYTANVIATPHIGFNTQEALVAKGEMAIKNIKEFLHED